MPAVVKVLASAANYMICDDHEFVDDLGKRFGGPAHAFTWCSSTMLHKKNIILDAEKSTYLNLFIRAVS